MNKQDLSDAIAEGILKAVTLLMGTAALAFVIIIVGLIFMPILVNNNNNIQTVYSPSCFPLENLRCDVISRNNTGEQVIDSFSICGYQEANAFLEQFKQRPEFRMSTLYLECD